VLDAEISNRFLGMVGKAKSGNFKKYQSGFGLVNQGMLKN
jgi:hypothetical protein